MKKYEYVHLKILKLFHSEVSEHREIINQYAEKGYRYVGYIPTDMDYDGQILEIDLIFEMDV